MFSQDNDSEKWRDPLGRLSATKQLVLAWDIIVVASLGLHGNRGDFKKRRGAKAQSLDPICSQAPLQGGVGLGGKRSLQVSLGMWKGLESPREGGFSRLHQK